jgi:hypothetical protein
MGELLFPNVNEVALETDLLEKGIGVLNVLTKQIAHQDDVVFTALMELDKGNEIMAEIMTWVQVRSFSLRKTACC